MSWHTRVSLTLSLSVSMSLTLSLSAVSRKGGCSLLYWEVHLSSNSETRRRKDVKDSSSTPPESST